MMTHQGRRTANHTSRIQAAYRANATNQVGAWTWKNFCLRNCMAWLQAAFYRLTMGFAKFAIHSGQTGLAKVPAEVTRARTRTPGAQRQPGHEHANTRSQSHNSTAMHHMTPGPGARIVPTTSPPS